MQKKEAKYQIILNQYLREKKFYCYPELKYTDKDYFAFSKIEQDQYDGLQATEKSGLVWKLSDADGRPKPCDAISAPPLPSYLVIRFPDAFYFIRFRDIVMMRENGSIAITREQAKKIAERIVS